MQIWSPGWSVRDDGDYAVTFNPGNDHAFAIIDLSGDGATALVIQSPEEADRLIRAAVKAKQLLDPPAPEPVTPEEVAALADSIRAGTYVVVTDDEPDARICDCCGELTEGECAECADCAPGRVEHPAPAEHPFDAGEGSRELAGPGRELLREAIAEQDAADEAPASVAP